MGRTRKSDFSAEQLDQSLSDEDVEEESTRRPQYHQDRHTANNSFKRTASNPPSQEQKKRGKTANDLAPPRDQRDVMKAFRADSKGLAMFCKLQLNSGWELQKLLDRQLHAVREKDPTQPDPFGYCAAFTAFKQLTREDTAYQEHSKKVNNLFASCMEELFCIGPLSIPSLVVKNLVCGHGTGKDFMQYNEREFNSQRAAKYLSIMKGENPREKWNRMQSSTIHVMFTKDTRRLYDIVRPPGVSKNEWVQLPPSALSKDIQNWLNDQRPKPGLTDLLIAIAGQHRCSAFVMYMDEEPPLEEWAAIFGDAMNFKFWLLLPQRVSHQISGVRMKLFLFLKRKCTLKQISPSSIDHPGN